MGITSWNYRLSIGSRTFDVFILAYKLVSECNTWLTRFECLHLTPRLRKWCLAGFGLMIYLGSLES